MRRLLHPPRCHLPQRMQSVSAPAEGQQARVCACQRIVRCGWVSAREILVFQSQLSRCLPKEVHRRGNGMCGILWDLHTWRVSVKKSHDRHLLQVFKRRWSLPAGHWGPLRRAWVCRAEVQIGVPPSPFLAGVAAIGAVGAGEENDSSAQQNILVSSSQSKDTAAAKRTHRTQNAQSRPARIGSYWSTVLSTQSQNHQFVVRSEARKGRRVATAPKEWI